MMEHMSRAPRLRALRRLLEYAVAESEELGLAHMDKLLSAAALAVGDELNSMKAARPQQARKREAPENRGKWSIDNTRLLQVEFLFVSFS
jgi:hypothetical protein